jgi:flavin reductase (DIM6/NTAB) family NADH-FMN oxidoreductase RutF
MRDSAAAVTLERLWSPPTAVTAAYEGRASGLISSTAVSASLLPESPRVVVVLSKANLTHDLVLASGAFALHLLPAAPEDALARALEVFRLLGMRSGHDVEKLDALAHQRGVTGSPLLDDALAYIEARVAASLDVGEVTVVAADVVAAGTLREGESLTIETVRERMPPEWLAEWDERRAQEISAASRLRSR